MALLFKATIELAAKLNHYRITWLDKQTGEEDSFQQLVDESLREELEEWWYDSGYQLPIGEKLFRFLDGEHHFLENALAKSQKYAEEVILQLYTGPETDNWPFELLARGKKFLLLGRFHLVRCVSDWGEAKVIEPVNRTLKLLFMASSALDGAPELDFEKEEEAIIQITEKLPVDIDVEDSGSIKGLGEKLLHNQYDVVHLSGHAGIDKQGLPFFVMEDETGYGQDVYADKLWDEALKNNPPQVLFLSGCRTGETPGITGIKRSEMALSYARSLAELNRIRVILGWGRPVGDLEAIEAEKIFYRELSRGNTILEAVRSAREELIKRFPDSAQPAWPLLRMFGSEMMMNALVKAGQKMTLKPRQIKHGVLKQSGMKVPEQGFVGRRRQLQVCLKALLKDNDKVGVLLHGTGGLGKSCLAIKICERFPNYYLIIVHGKFNAITLAAALKDAFVAAQDKKGKEVLAEAKDMREKLADLCAVSFKEKNYLMVLDDFEQNLEEYEEGQPGSLLSEAAALLQVLLHYLPFSGKMTQAIITSRYLFTLTEQGKELVSERLQPVSLTSFHETEQWKKARELNHIMGYIYTDTLLVGQLLSMGWGNPRLMEWIDGLVGQMEDAEVPELIEAVKDKQEEFIRSHVLRELILKSGADVKLLLERMSIYRQPVAVKGVDYVAFSAGLVEWERCLHRAVSLSLVEHDGAREVYGVTPMLREELEKSLSQAETDSSHRAAFKYYRQICEAMESIDPLLHEEWVYHALACGEEEVSSKEGGQLVVILREGLAFLESQRVGEWILKVKKRALATEHDAFLLNELGSTISELGDSKKAIFYYEQALAINECIFGNDHPEVAREFNNLGISWSDQGDYQKAISYYSKALSINEGVYGKDHPDVAINLNNLGEAWSALGDNQKSISYYKQSLAINEHILGKKDPAVATDMNNLGEAWRNLGKPKKAIKYFNEALAILKVVYGNTHQDIATVLNNLGAVWSDLEEHRKAIFYYKKALNINQLLFGKVHPNVANCLNNLGDGWRSLDKSKKAIKYFNEALAILKVVYGNAHQDIANVLNNLGSAWSDLEEHRKAISYYEQSLAINEGIYGKNHPDVAINLNNLGAAWSALGDNQKAIPYYEQALAIDEGVFGKGHPDVAKDMNNLGEAWRDLGKPKKAIKHFSHALVILKEVFGDTHQDVAIALNNLGLAWSDLEEHRKAISYYEQSLAINEGIYGKNHPDVAINLNNLGEAWSALEDNWKAVSYYERALTIDDRALGKNHPDVAKDLNNLGVAYFSLGDNAKARHYFQNAYNICRTLFGEQHPDTQTVKEWLDSC